MEWTCMELMTVFSYIKYINDLQLLSRTKEFDGIDRDLPWTTMAMARIVMSISLIAETSGDDRFDYLNMDQPKKNMVNSCQ